MENIKKAQKIEYFYSEREREQAISDYRSFVFREVQKLQELYPKLKEQEFFESTKDDRYSFDDRNVYSMKIERIKQRILSTAEELEKKYDTQVDVPDFAAMFEDKQQQ